MIARRAAHFSPTISLRREPVGAIWRMILTVVAYSSFFSAAPQHLAQNSIFVVGEPPPEPGDLRAPRDVGAVHLTLLKMIWWPAQVVSLVPLTEVRLDPRPGICTSPTRRLQSSVTLADLIRLPHLARSSSMNFAVAGMSMGAGCTPSFANRA